MNLLFRLFVAIFCPPLIVYIDYGMSYHMLFNVFLTSFVWLLGIGHAWALTIAFSLLSLKKSLMKYSFMGDDFLTKSKCAVQKINDDSVIDMNHKQD
ncbi:hypothetical protein DICVIV_04596 [Dictyocaulus viviparus]|uniref:Uncharacterized protein n=1 Tax=Dictyocaulus viviparus TaxID=29172 RepID=A0A0D8XZU2_DICVI|nr:hypothetical protein DICVIV_04596 [Dictyocaulus viviparus]